MADESNIPVCTLFNQTDDTTTGDGNFFSDQSPSISAKKEETNREDESRESSDNVSSKQPVVCDLFKSVPSEEDLFSGLSNSTMSAIHKSGQVFTDKDDFDDIVQTEGSNKSDPSEKVIYPPNNPPNDLSKLTMSATNNSGQVFTEKDDFNDIVQTEGSDKSDPSEKVLPHNDLSEIFHTVVADTKDETCSEPDDDFEKDVSKNVTFDANSDMMASVLINDDSFDNISSICMEQSSKLDTPDTEITNTSVTIESESCDELEATSEKTCDMISITEPSSSDVSSGQAEINTQIVSKPVPETITPYITSAFYSTKEKKEKNVDHSTEVPSSHAGEEVDKSVLQVASSLFGQSNLSSPFDAIEETSSLEHTDAFTNALHTSEVSRRRDAWIPSESTRMVLSAVAQSQKRIALEPVRLTRPRLVTSESLGDPVKAVIARHKGLDGAIERETLSASSVSCDKTGLRQLIMSGNFRAAVDLCGLALTNLGQGFGRATQESVNSSATLQWWQTRFSLLIHLKLYDLAVAELEQFRGFDKPDLYYEFYPDVYPGRRGSMVPFSLRLLNADFPRHISKPTEALARLYSLQHVCTKVVSNLDAGHAEDGTGMQLKDEDRDASLKLWTQRRVKVRYCIGNTLLQLREYHSAVKVFDKIIEDKPEDAVALLSGIGRALLQLGDIKAAQQRFAQAERLAGHDPWHKVQLVSNRGFLYLGANNWKEALNQFDEALTTDPTNIEALNNKAVCLLYLSRLREAIAVQEEAVRLKKEATQPLSSNPSKHNEIPFEGALSNLVTLYELESAKSMKKKQDLLNHVAGRSGDGFNVTCLKM